MSQETLLLILIFFGWVLYKNHKSEYVGGFTSPIKDTDDWLDAPLHKESKVGLSKFKQRMFKAYPHVKKGEIVPSLTSKKYHYRCIGFNENGIMWKRIIHK